MELAENNGKNKDNQDSDDQNSDNPVSSHPDCASLETVENWGKGDYLRAMLLSVFTLRST